MKTKELVMCALCAAITCVLAPLSLPIGPIPISLCTFAVMLAGTLLGAKWGFISQLIYVLLGIAGLPVFAGYKAGLGVIMGPTGGYIIAYPILALLCGFLYHRFRSGRTGAAKIGAMVAAMVIGTVVLYAVGTAWFCFVAGSDVAAALGLCVLPFLPGDALKMAAVAVIVPQLERALSRAGIGVTAQA